MRVSDFYEYSPEADVPVSPSFKTYEELFEALRNEHEYCAFFASELDLQLPVI